MKQARKEVDEINRLYDIVKSTDSPTLRRDSKKAIVRKTEDLREYCRYRGLNFSELSNQLKVRYTGGYVRL